MNAQDGSHKQNEGLMWELSKLLLKLKKCDTLLKFSFIQVTYIIQFI